MLFYYSCASFSQLPLKSSKCCFFNLNSRMKNKSILQGQLHSLFDPVHVTGVLVNSCTIRVSEIYNTFQLNHENEPLYESYNMSFT